MTDIKKIHTIKACCHQSSRTSGFECGPDYVKEAYNHIFDSTNFNGSVVKPDEQIAFCQGYKLLYDHVLDQKQKEPDTIILTVGGDHSVSASTIGAMNDFYMKQHGNTFTSELMILYIDAYPDLAGYNATGRNDLPEMTMSSLQGYLDPPISPQKLSLTRDQIIYFGLQEDEDFEVVGELGYQNLSCPKIKALGAEAVLGILKDMIGDRPVHISLDMKVFDQRVASCTEPATEGGLEFNDLVPVLLGLRTNLVSMDLVEFNPKIGSSQDVARTAELARECLVVALGLKKKRLNVFNEESQFLIYRPLEQEDGEEEHDIGWYLVRGMDMTQREQFLKIVPDDSMITIDIDGEDYLITKTTMNEQNERSYLSAESIHDMALFPEEKVEMGFVLIQ